MQIIHNEPARNPVRELLSTRRFNAARWIEHEGSRYRVSAGWFPDGRLAELFIDSGKFGTAMQANADTAAVLVSMLLQYGVAPDVILHSISGPVAIALKLFMDDAP